ncbi:MAG: DUF5329 domain-containing protein [Psychromonas sp.]|nr:DUF5329 domain-containing protein [Alteromonadales bacterium]MCP5076964.1 DUF5329 domain-containing protein [Psychromonas sp.]
MVKAIQFVFLLILSSFSFANSEQEISYLLDFVGKTECSYLRNGSSHNGKEARSHIQKKYDYYHDDIKTAEDFIAYSATKSTMSGTKYTIQCDGKKVQFSGEWLNTELKRYRAQLSEK